MLKRWRRKGFFSEFRNSKEYGSYQSLIDFLSIEFTDYSERYNARKDNGTNMALANLQTVIESILNSVTEITFNWNILPEWQKRNIRRNLGDNAGVMIAMLIIIALYGLKDDDDIKDDPYLASILYLSDRLYSDTTMYSPLGLVSEFKNTYSSPIASANGPSDLITAAKLVTGALFDPDFNPEYTTGQYRGRNKLEVLLRRNIPGVRPMDRIKLITKNNKYYKVGESQTGVNIAKNIGESIYDD